MCRPFLCLEGNGTKNKQKKKHAVLFVAEKLKTTKNQKTLLPWIFNNKFIFKKSL